MSDTEFYGGLGASVIVTVLIAWSASDDGWRTTIGKGKEWPFMAVISAATGIGIGCLLIIAIRDMAQ